MNVMILPSSAFDDTTAIIDEVGQLAHIKTVLKADVGDTLKNWQIGR